MVGGLDEKEEEGVKVNSREGMREGMMETKEFPAGTVARCNRCNQPSLMPKASAGIRENAKTWRLQRMMTLGCGHCDAHWVHDIDLIPTPEVSGE